MNITTNITLDKVIGVAIRKALEFKKVAFANEEEVQEFIEKLCNDEEFLTAAKNIIEVTRD